MYLAGCTDTAARRVGRRGRATEVAMPGWQWLDAGFMRFLGRPTEDVFEFHTFGCIFDMLLGFYNFRLTLADS
jgi:hypothetical protein